MSRTRRKAAAARSEPKPRGASAAAERAPAAAREPMIAVAAYYRAERRGFAPGSELDDWLAAEADIEALLASRQKSVPRGAV